MADLKQRPLPPGPGFGITGKKGFHITFANGWTVSVQFGPGNYCQNYDREIAQDEERCGRDGSYNAEVAAWPRNGAMVSLGGDTVEGWQKPDDVLRLMQAAASAAPDATTLDWTPGPRS